jgi:hypothetical protein
VDLVFTPDAIKEIALLAEQINTEVGACHWFTVKVTVKFCSCWGAIMSGVKLISNSTVVIACS